MRDVPAAGASRWLRLRPADAVDVVLLVWAGLGLVLSLVAWVLMDELGFGGGAATFVVVVVLRWHGSTPVFLFLAGAFYLTRRGRTVGPTRRWVWAGLAVTVPLWFLLGLPLSVRGLGDVTVFLLLLNLVGAGLMGWGVWRTLSAPGP